MAGILDRYRGFLKFSGRRRLGDGVFTEESLEQNRHDDRVDEVAQFGVGATLTLADHRGQAFHPRTLTSSSSNRVDCSESSFSSFATKSAADSDMFRPRAFWSTALTIAVSTIVR